MLSLLLIPIFALCSGLHGWGRIGKGFVIAISLLGAFCIGLASLPWFCSIGFSAVAGGIFWGTMRRGWQAKAELVYMAGYPFASIFDVVDGYIIQTIIAGAILGVVGWWQNDVLAMWLSPLVALSCLLPAASLLVFNYETRIGNRLKNNGRFIDCRRVTELFGGMVGGIVSSVVLYTSQQLIG
jgi:hypothetical protein